MSYENKKLLEKFDSSLKYMDFVVHLSSDVQARQQKRFSYRMSKGNACAAYFHRCTKEGKTSPHLHVLIGLHADDFAPYVENLWCLFEANNKHQRFGKLMESNVRTHLRDWKGMFLYISNPWGLRDAEQRFLRFRCEQDMYVTAA